MSYEKLKAIPGEKKWVDYCEETESWAIFGEKSGFQFANGFGSEQAAEDYLNETY